jgi:bifunctional non-homologous end joining protein LigD
MKAGKTAGLIFFAFDLLWLGDQDLRALPLLERKRRLQGILTENKDQKMIQLAEHLDVAGSDVLKAACNLKLEGICPSDSQSLKCQAAPAFGPRRSAGPRNTL